MRDILNCLALFCNLPQENVKRLLSAGVADALADSAAAAAATNNTTVEKRDSAGTQTEIVAVHTPQIENHTNFPFTKARPSSLPLDKQQKQQSTTSGHLLSSQIVEEQINESGVVSEESAAESLGREKTDELKERRVAAATKSQQQHSTKI